MSLSKLSKSIIKLSGPDTTSFLNGLVTTRFLPNIIKKNQHTISDVDIRHAHLNDILDLKKDWGIMHEDLYDPENHIMIRRDGVSSMFLNAKGRVLTDCFIYPFRTPQQDPQFMIEVESSITSKLMFMLNMYKLGAKVNFEETSLKSYYVYHDSMEFDEYLEELQAKYCYTFNPKDAEKHSDQMVEDEVLVNKANAGKLIGWAVDNRIPNFGIKLVTDGEIDESFLSESFRTKFPVKVVEEKEYRQRRFMNGLFEASDAPKNFQLLPFDMNIDYINGMSADKGCYVGQELTSRTYNGGVLRKRIFPFQFFELTDEKLAEIDEMDDLKLEVGGEVTEDLSTTGLENLEVTPLIEQETSEEAVASPFGKMKKRKLNIGKILSVQDNLGFILLRLESVKDVYFKVEVPSLNPKFIGLKVMRPNWWPEDDRF